MAKRRPGDAPIAAVIAGIGSVRVAYNHSLFKQEQTDAGIAASIVHQ
ncbi:Hypothetical protein I596_1894 [Dokdonella koreensis DS-123]|uniref:Uncharacterized protein n=1 Tax=Dokdonella koreensis DS-123 TaxID=1300342 RepID=A0A160DU20_9GAMM|nr:Hypothetical protein I596_1894 [Dokdonella koreensis DS-123]